MARLISVFRPRSQCKLSNEVRPTASKLQTSLASDLPDANFVQLARPVPAGGRTAEANFAVPACCPWRSARFGARP